MIGSNQSKTNLVTTAILAAPDVDALTSNKQIIKGKPFSASDLSQLSKGIYFSVTKRNLQIK